MITIAATLLKAKILQSGKISFIDFSYLHSGNTNYCNVCAELGRGAIAKWENGGRHCGMAVKLLVGCPDLILEFLGLSPFSVFDLASC